MVGNVNGTSSTVPTGATIVWKVNGVIDAGITALSGQTTNSLVNGDVITLELTAPDGATSNNSVIIPTPQVTGNNLNYGENSIELDLSNTLLPNGSNPADVIRFEFTGMQGGSLLGIITLNTTRGAIASLTAHLLDFSGWSYNSETSWSINILVTEFFNHSEGNMQQVRSFEDAVITMPTTSTVIAIIDSVLP